MKSFVDINAKIFKNKKNGQISITLPKKELKRMFNNHSNNLNVPKNLPIRIFKWS
jgi:hypothetical protein